MISKIIRQRRKELDLTLAELAKRVGVTEPTVQRWESGKIKNLRHDKIVRLANALQMYPAELMGWKTSEHIYTIPNIIPVPKASGLVPLLGTTNGNTVFSEQNIENYLAVPEGLFADFCLRCRGEWMINVRLFDGDIVYVRAQNTVQNGEIAAVLLQNEATIRRVYTYENRLELRPENPVCPVLNFEGEETKQVRILGKAVGFLSHLP